MPGHPWLWLVYIGIRLFHKDQHFAKIQFKSDMYNTCELHCMDPHCRYSMAITTWRQEITMRFQGAYHILTCMILGWWFYWIDISEQIDERHFARAIYIQFPKKHDPIFYNISVSNNGYISLDRLWSNVTIDHASETWLVCFVQTTTIRGRLRCNVKKYFAISRSLLYFDEYDSRHFIFTSSLMKLSEIKRHQTSKISGSISQ